MSCLEGTTVVARRHGQKALLRWAERKQLRPNLSWRCLEAQVGWLAMERLQPRIVRAAGHQVGLAVSFHAVGVAW